MTIQFEYREDNAMAFENNRPANFSDVALAGRDISARRAATIANMVDEAAARGLDDEFARAAIRRYGADNARAMRAGMDDPDSFREFSERFGAGYGKQIYENEVVERTEDRYVLDFHYCPYVAEWVRQGRKPEEISRLCSIAMEGDHECARQFPCLKFHLDQTIADSAPTCRLRFERVKEENGGDSENK